MRFGLGDVFVQLGPVVNAARGFDFRPDVAGVPGPKRAEVHDRPVVAGRVMHMVDVQTEKRAGNSACRRSEARGPGLNRGQGGIVQPDRSGQGCAEVQSAGDDGDEGVHGDFSPQRPDFDQGAAVKGIRGTGLTHIQRDPLRQLRPDPDAGPNRACRKLNPLRELCEAFGNGNPLAYGSAIWVGCLRSVVQRHVFGPAGIVAPARRNAAGDFGRVGGCVCGRGDRRVRLLKAGIYECLR